VGGGGYDLPVNPSGTAFCRVFLKDKPSGNPSEAVRNPAGRQVRSAECGVRNRTTGTRQGSAEFGVRNAEWTHEFHEFSRIVRVTAAWGWAAPFGSCWNWFFDYAGCRRMASMQLRRRRRPKTRALRGAGAVGKAAARIWNSSCLGKRPICKKTAKTAFSILSNALRYEQLLC
jgi:hypothetical protein